MKFAVKFGLMIVAALAIQLVIFLYVYRDLVYLHISPFRKSSAGVWKRYRTTGRGPCRGEN